MNMENDNNMTENKIKKQQALEILKKHMENIQKQVKDNKFKKSSVLVKETIDNDGSMKDYIIKNYYVGNKEILQKKFNNFQNTNKEENILNKKQQVVIKK